ncbi:MAG: hypothetical protein H7175_09160 [Burkholderiales bacterium]|nr:hypothetical protein [Anaerolineae bacterium]
MSTNATQLEAVVALAETLSPLDKIRLAERLMATLQNDLLPEQNEPLPSLYGLWANLGVNISADDIDEARKEMWGNFPREDI